MSPKNAELELQKAKSPDMQAITGFRVIDKQFQLIFIECPTKFNAFEKLRMMCKQMEGITTKANPKLKFLNRLFPNSNLCLNEVTLARPMTHSLQRYSPQLQLLIPLSQLFEILPSSTPPLIPLHFDLA